MFEFATGSPPNSNLRERIQIGRQLSRNTPKLSGERHSDQLKDLVSYSLDSDPATRPSMEDILNHPYIANSADKYPTSSLSELVRIYYQWTQAGGQRASLFNPGGAAAAVMPSFDTTFGGDWNFSTTDNFERRYSVLDFDQLRASLDEMAAELNRPEDSIEPIDVQFEPTLDADMTLENRANFEERVQRGATAMEAIFDQSKPQYTYETKNDFVPVEERESYSDLPLGNDADRSSMVSTSIDLDFGAFDSSHYAAGSASAQPFQIADGNTLRAARLSGGHFNGDSNEANSQSSSMVSEELEESNFQDDIFQPQTGPRPPTMEWSFPTFASSEEEEEIPDFVSAEGEPEHGQYAAAQESEPENEPTEKRATMQWSFPAMSDESSVDNASEQVNRFSTARGPMSPLRDELAAHHESHESIGEPGDARLSTTASVIIETDDYDQDHEEHDPYHSDGITPQTPSATSFDSENEHSANTSTSDQPLSPVLLEGPGPDEEDSAFDTRGTSPEEDPELFTTAVPTKERANAILRKKRQNSSYSPSESSTTTDQRDTISPSPLQAARGGGGGGGGMSSIMSSNMNSPETTPRHRKDLSGDIEAAVSFPEIVPPSMESMTEGADNSVVSSEMDRLLADFLSALSATGNALTKVGVVPGETSTTG